MKHLEFYVKHKTHRPTALNEYAQKGWWHNLVITVAVVLIEPLIMYKHYRHVIPFSQSYYLHQVKYALWVGVPYSIFRLWSRWRGTEKRRRGYRWVGKFEVISKHSFFLLYFLTLSPGEGNRIRVDGAFFQKVRVGDFIIIRRDALGTLEKVINVRRFTTSLTRTKAIN